MRARCRARTEIPAEEQIVHELGELLAVCNDPDEIEKSFLAATRRLTSARSVQWIRGPLPPLMEPGEGILEIPVQAGSVVRGRLLVKPASGQGASYTPATLERLRTLCTMAASALPPFDCNARHLVSRPIKTSGLAAPAENGRSEPEESPDPVSLKQEHPPAGRLFHDATFLHAVLPFALGLARRHDEPLSLLCLAIDRLNGVHELLGRDYADRLVRSVGQHIAAMLRESDIVARLDDDRIIVVLPRTFLHHAWNVAREIARAVAANPELMPELPDTTISVGVAEFPACAGNVYSLLDAADHALTLARARGTNRTVAASSVSSKQSHHLAIAQ